MPGCGTSARRGRRAAAASSPWPRRSRPGQALSNKGTLNVLLDRTISGLPAGQDHGGPVRQLFRVTDKALREYDAAHAELLLYVSPFDGLRTSPYLRAIDHIENCVSATRRAALNALRASKIGRAGPRLTPRQEERLAHLHNAIEHSDEKLQGKQFGKSPPFGKPDPYSLRLANTCMVIGASVLTCRELVAAMTRCHATIEVIRDVPTGTPGPAFPNARLQTEPGDPVATTGTYGHPPTSGR